MIKLYRVLLVEDDRTNLFFYENMKEWEENGFKICGEARNGREALDELEKNEYDMILIDIMMPIMNGLELLEALQERKKKIISIIASTYAEFEYVRQGMRYGAMDYLIKPVKSQDLTRCLGKVKEKLEEDEEFDLIDKIFIKCGIVENSRFIERLKNYFRHHNEISLTEISEEFQLSKDYFGKIFKSHMNENFNQFVLRFKMEYAKILLKNCDSKIYEISETLGYKSVDYFTKIFREYTGKSPKKYHNLVHEETLKSKSDF